MKQEKIPHGVCLIVVILFILVYFLGAYLIKHQLSLATVAIVLLPVVLGIGLMKLMPIVRKIVIILSAMFAMGLMLNFFIFYNKIKSKLSLLEYSQINYSMILIIIFLIWIVIYLNFTEVKRRFIRANKSNLS